MNATCKPVEKSLAELMTLEKGRSVVRGHGRYLTNVHRTFVTACLLIAVGIPSFPRAYADGGKGKAAPGIVQQMQCGSHRVVITCGKPKPGDVLDSEEDAEDSGLCVHNSMKFIGAAGAAKKIPGFKDDAINASKGNPGSMHCGVGSDGKHYVEVTVDYCEMPSCAVLVMMTEAGREIASRSATSDEDTESVNRYEGFRRKHKIHFAKDFGK